MQDRDAEDQRRIQDARLDLASDRLDFIERRIKSLERGTNIKKPYTRIWTPEDREKARENLHRGLREARERRAKEVK